MKAARYRLCRLDALDDPGSAVFEVPAEGAAGEIMVVRRGARVYGYRNHCPHTGGPLDWVPGEFLDLDRRFIQCATHDALFRIDDGYCVQGPCAGESLRAVALACEAGVVWYLAAAR